MALLKTDKSTFLGKFLLTRTNALPCTVYGLNKTPQQQRVDRTVRGERHAF
jgi:hypothetical protein